MKKTILLVSIVVLASCAETTDKKLTAQEIIDKAIGVSGGELYNKRKVSFVFRDKKYVSEVLDGKKILKRITYADSLRITDVKTHSGFQRFFNDSLIKVSDSIANRYANSVNSVHYFARLPFGLNDDAVKKELLGEIAINNTLYYKLKITFEQNNGGKDFDDIYLYWFNKSTFKPDFLAYEFHVNGGGIRFRKAYNERYVEGIRFVDYNNLKPKEKSVSIFETDSLFQSGGLELLSKIELDSIKVSSY